MTSPRPRRAARLALAAGLACLALPVAAHADSIVYIDGDAVWSAAPDGSHKVQLTDADYHSVTQADDGTFAAARNGAIDVFARDGRPLRSIATLPAKTGNGGDHRGTPVNLAFSPDGATIAYEYADATCPPASSCSEQYSTFYTNSTGPAASPFAVYGQQFGRSEPSFVTNTRTLVFGGANHSVNFDDLGGGDSSTTDWFSFEDDFSDGELSRDGRRLAVNFGYGGNTRLAFLVVRGDPATSVPAKPTVDDTVCESSEDIELHGATWSPDGNALAYGSSKGIELVRFSAYAPGNCGIAGESVLAPTGKSPDWGPADPPAARNTGAVAPQTPAAPGPQAAPAPVAGGPAPSRARKRLRVRKVKATSGALRKGLKVRLAAPATGRVTAKLTLRGRTVAKGRAAAGATTVRLSRVKAKPGKRYTLTVRAGGMTVKRTLKPR